MNPAFPPALAGTIAQMLEGVSRKDLAQRAGKLSAAYRAGGTSAGIGGRDDALAYLLARAPATFAASAAVFDRIKQRLPDFAPKSLSDIGAGPGTASWAATTAWPSLTAIAMLEPNAAFRDMAQKLMPAARVVAGDLGAEKTGADLVVAAYVLAEQPERIAGAIAVDLWKVTGRMLVLIEPGTPQGFARIRAARAALIEAGAHIAAPCTHDNACPIRSVGESRSDNNNGDDWCHFSQRLPRSRDHMTLKTASVPFEDERYSYVAAMPEKIASGARLVKPPVESKSGIMLPLCDETGLRNPFIAGRDKAAYRAVRKLEWGDWVRTDRPS
jgi:ribosomal protein RSM22 (predicted rRNA methylase)